jgi:hypothetical protein
MSLQVLSSAGMLAIRTVGAPGTHGAGITGTHGCGVNTPNAAAVAAATAGFASDEHMPKGMMFTSGLLSMMFASGVCVKVRLTGNTTSELGAAPKLHFNVAPMHTCNGMIETSN